MLMMMLMLAVGAVPAFPFDEAVSLHVTQVNELRWDAPARPVQQWIFSCGEQVKTMIDGARTSVTFGDLVNEDGIYTRCGIVAENNGQLSTPYPVPNFAYRYSYWPLARMCAEIVGLCVVMGGLWRPLRQRYIRRHAALLLATPPDVQTIVLSPLHERRMS